MVLQVRKGVFTVINFTIALRLAYVLTYFFEGVLEIAKHHGMQVESHLSLAIQIEVMIRLARYELKVQQAQTNFASNVTANEFRSVNLYLVKQINLVKVQCLSCSKTL